MSARKAAPSTSGPATEPQVPLWYTLRLYVTGLTPRSIRATANVRKICEERLGSAYDLEIVDISAHPAIAERFQIIAAPTLIKEFPLPQRRFIGDMSQTNRILHGLGLSAIAAPALPATRG